MEVDCRGSTTCSFLKVIPLIQSKRFQKLASLSAISKNIPVELVDPQMLMTVILVSNIYKQSTSGLFLLIITTLLFKITTGRNKKNPWKNSKHRRFSMNDRGRSWGPGRDTYGHWRSKAGPWGRKTSSSGDTPWFLKWWLYVWSSTTHFFRAWFMNHHVLYGRWLPGLMLGITSPIVIWGGLAIRGSPITCPKKRIPDKKILTSERLNERLGTPNLSRFLPK